MASDAKVDLGGIEIDIDLPKREALFYDVDVPRIVNVDCCDLFGARPLRDLGQDRVRKTSRADGIDIDKIVNRVVKGPDVGGQVNASRKGIGRIQAKEIKFFCEGHRFEDAIGRFVF